MTILQINKFWYRHGGADAYAIDLAADLKKRGHEVLYFGTQDKRNIKTSTDEYCVPKRSISREDYAHKGGIIKKISAAAGVIYDTNAAAQLDRLLREHKPDIAHLHNIYHHLSPSILGVLRRHDIPVIQTLHDYKRMCPNHAMFTQGSICERCNGRKYWNAVTYKCIFEATLPSAVVATEMAVQSMFGWYDRYIDRFIAPSQFMKTKLEEWGRRTDNVDVIPYAVHLASTDEEGEHVLYAGRLSAEKGVHIVLEVARALPEIRFDIAGDGPLRKELETMVKNNHINNVQFHGMVDQKRLAKLRKRSAFMLIPSQWYENYPIALLEQFAHGKTAIGSQLGGIPEIIRHEKNGYVIPHDDVKKWIETTRKLWHERPLIKKFGEAAHAQVARINDPDTHYDAIMNAYKKTIQTRHD